MQPLAVQIAQTPAEQADSNANLLSSPSGANGVVFSDLMTAILPAVEKATTEQSSADPTDIQSIQAAELNEAADNADQDLAALAAASQLATRGVTLRAPSPSAPIRLQNLDMGGLTSMIATEFGATNQDNIDTGDADKSDAETLDDQTHSDIATVAAPGAELNVQALIEIAMATSVSTKTNQLSALDDGRQTVLATSTAPILSDIVAIISATKTSVVDGAVELPPTKGATAALAAASQLATRGVTLRAPSPSAPIRLQNLDMGGLTSMIATEFGATNQDNIDTGDADKSDAETLDDQTHSDIATVAAPGAELNVQALIEIAMATSVSTKTNQLSALDDGRQTVLATSTAPILSDIVAIISATKTSVVDGAVELPPTKGATEDHLSDTESTITETAVQRSELPKKNQALQRIVWFEDASRAQALAVAPAQNSDDSDSPASHVALIDDKNSLEMPPSKTIEREENQSLVQTNLLLTPDDAVHKSTHSQNLNIADLVLKERNQQLAETPVANEPMSTVAVVQPIIEASMVKRADDAAKSEFNGASQFEADETLRASTNTVDMSDDERAINAPLSADSIIAQTPPNIPLGVPSYPHTPVTNDEKSIRDNVPSSIGSIKGGPPSSAGEQSVATKAEINTSSYAQIMEPVEAASQVFIGKGSSATITQATSTEEAVNEPIAIQNNQGAVKPEWAPNKSSPQDPDARQSATDEGKAYDEKKFGEKQQLNVKGDVNIRELMKLGAIDATISFQSPDMPAVAPQELDQPIPIPAPTNQQAAPQQVAPLSTSNIETNGERRTIADDIRLRALERMVVNAARNGTQILSIQLYPPGLGQVVLRLAMDGQRLRLATRAATTEAADTLRNMEADLRDALAGNGLQLAGFDVSEDGTNDEAQRRQPAESVVKARSEGTKESFIVDLNA